ncbi:type II toxin-antitoxin system VapB family antitoxin [Kitasatospora paracochleata]|uniref:Arc/MetJ family transcription regulator n=1 Tax=Kitasatospora paracochleata TaxID=58354 RepID=A0ABT1J4F2_9ACTN|nr:hypothetical protein [Kitasatospora paracochleata]MCP2312310.1 Arc/MetJ family transcription regulator [Kitasatospora paracochleata]
MSKVTISLDADLAIETMLLSGTKSPQEAVELLVHDYLATRRRTEARTGDASDAERLRRPDAIAEEG